MVANEQKLEAARVEYDRVRALTHSKPPSAFAACASRYRVAFESKSLASKLLYCNVAKLYR